MGKLRFEVFEDNGGGITMFVLRDEVPVWAHSGYEYTPENLLADIEALKEDDDISGWDGNGMHDGLRCESWEDMGISLEKYYRELSVDKWAYLVADSDGIYQDNMGINAKRAFGAGEEE